MFLDDIAGMSFYRKARWSKVRVTVHSGREVVFEKDQVTVYPCRLAYMADNETIEGIRSSLEEMKENENAEDEEETRETFRREEIDDDFLDTSEGEPTQSGPKHVECEPFPQEIADEITR